MIYIMVSPSLIISCCSWFIHFFNCWWRHNISSPWILQTSLHTYYYFLIIWIVHGQSRSNFLTLIWLYITSIVILYLLRNLGILYLYLSFSVSRRLSDSHLICINFSSWNSHHRRLQHSCWWSHWLECHTFITSWSYYKFLVSSYSHFAVPFILIPFVPILFYLSSKFLWISE